MTSIHDRQMKNRQADTLTDIQAPFSQERERERARERERKRERERE